MRWHLLGRLRQRNPLLEAPRGDRLVTGDGAQLAGRDGIARGFFFGLCGQLLLLMLDWDFLYFSSGEVLSTVALRCAFKCGVGFFPPFSR